MLYVAYYAIQPRQRLLDLISEFSPSVRAFLQEPVLWSKKEGGTIFGQPEHYTAQVKLLFLANLCGNYIYETTNPEIRRLFDVLLGRPPYSVTHFDRWWQIQRYEVVEGIFETVEKELTLKEVKLLAKPDLDFVDRWLDTLIEKKIKNNPVSGINRD